MRASPWQTRNVLAPSHRAESIEQRIEPLARFVERNPHLFVLTGAGCSTDSGIPDYRDAEGSWKRPQPVQFQDFMQKEAVRSRYWARSLIGWRRFAQAEPNAAHVALAQLEAAGYVHQLVTQNVDGLHQRAGSRRVIDLHGRLDTVECLACRHQAARAEFQRHLETLNPEFQALYAALAPDGDADLDGMDFSTFRVPACRACGGVLKPAVVFFGARVPPAPRWISPSPA